MSATRLRHDCIAVALLLEFRRRHPTMPHAIISPSVLASDFGSLTAECKRMIKGGAEWLHMGTETPSFHTYFDSYLPDSHVDVMDG